MSNLKSGHGVYKIRIYPTLAQKKELNAYFYAVKQVKRLIADLRDSTDKVTLQLAAREIFLETAQQTGYKIPLTLYHVAFYLAYSAYTKLFLKDALMTRGDAWNAMDGYLRFHKIVPIRYDNRRDYDFSGRGSITLIRDSKRRYFALVSLKLQRPALPSTDKSVGLDYGVNELVVTSDGYFYAHDRDLTRMYARLAKLKSHLETQTKGSNRYKKTLRKVLAIRAKLSNKRFYRFHKISSELVRKYQVLYHESTHWMGRHQKAFNVAGTKHLHRFLTYKAAYHGREMSDIPSLSPCSQVCSNCWEFYPVASGKMGDKIAVCPNCGHTHHRDLNAARNILYVGKIGAVEPTA